MLRNPQRLRALMRAHTCTGEVDTQRWTRTSNCLRTVRGKLISTHKDTHNHADISWTRLKDTTPTLLREGRGRRRWDWIQTCLLTDRIELLISQQIVLWGIHGSTHGLSSSLRLRDSLCVDPLHMYTFVHQHVRAHLRWGNLAEGICTGQVRIIFCRRSGQCELALGQDRANSESIKPAGVMHTEGRLHPRCAERALTAHTLSGFFIGTQATAQSSALNTTNGKRGNGTFICLSSSGGLLLLLLLLIMHWNTGPPHSLGSITNINISQDEAHAIRQKLHCILSWGCGT